MKIYVITLEESEFDSCSNSTETIDFVSTSLEKAEEIWEKYYSKIKPNDKDNWYRQATLYEFEDDFFVHNIDSKYNILKTINNIA